MTCYAKLIAQATIHINLAPRVADVVAATAWATIVFPAQRTRRARLLDIFVTIAGRWRTVAVVLSRFTIRVAAIRVKATTMPERKRRRQGE